MDASATASDAKEVEPAGKSREQRTELSERTFSMIQNRLIERYGTAIARGSPDMLELTINWFPKRGGRQATFFMYVNEFGALRIECTRNTVEGISWIAPNGTHKMDVKINDGTYVRFIHDRTTQRLKANLYPDKKYGDTKTTEQFILCLVETILMA
jgi:hypothetical protein